MKKVIIISLLFGILIGLLIGGLYWRREYLLLHEKYYQTREVLKLFRK